MISLTAGHKSFGNYCMNEKLLPHMQNIHETIAWKQWDENPKSCWVTSHSAYVATETKLYGAKIDGLLPPNFL